MTLPASWVGAGPRTATFLEQKESVTTVLVNRNIG